MIGVLYQVNDRYSSFSDQALASSTFTKVTHSRTPSLSKQPISPLSGGHAEGSLPKRPRSFRIDSQSAPPFPNIGAHKASAFQNNTLSICAVCLGRHKHSVPVVFCAAKRTWNDQFDTFIERFNKALRVKDTGTILCSMWQRESGCHKKHDGMYACLGCGGLTHGASSCP